MLADCKNNNNSIIPAQPTVSNKNAVKCNRRDAHLATESMQLACTVRVNEGDTDSAGDTGEDNPSCGGNEFNLKIYVWCDTVLMGH